MNINPMVELELRDRLAAKDKEIERLREALDTIIEKNKPEIERANLHFKMLEDEVRGYNRMLDAYEEENERLREALRKIVEVTDYGTKTSTTMSQFAINNANILARSALQQKESE